MRIFKKSESRGNNDRIGGFITDSSQIIPSAFGTVTQTLLLTTSLPIGQFLPLFGEVSKLAQELINLYQTANHNKRICGVLLDRVQVAEVAVENLKIRHAHRKDFFTGQNLILMRELVKTIKEIKSFAKRIRELRGWLKFFQAKSISETFNELTSKFDYNMSSLNFIITIDTNLQAQIDNEALRADVKQCFEVRNFFQLVKKDNYFNHFESFFFFLINWTFTIIIP